jgi:CubicO group peptidase (beta-lactamase class C family)
VQKGESIVKKSLFLFSAIVSFLVTSIYSQDIHQAAKLRDLEKVKALLALRMANDRPKVVHAAFLGDKNNYKRKLGCMNSEVAKEGRYDRQIDLIEKYIESYMKENKVPGLSIAFYKDDYVWSNGFGLSDIENRVSAKQDTAYLVSSITKSFTAVGILKLWEDGKLSLDDEVQKYVPYFPKKQWPITIRQLLEHLGGISNYTKDQTELKGHYYDHHTTEEAIAIFRDLDLVAKPGAEFVYSSYGYNLLGAVVEGASGQNYENYMREHVWGPLNMTSTRIDNPEDIVINRARGYKVEDHEIKNAKFINHSYSFSSGGALSTAPDLIKFAKGLDEKEILSEETQMLMYNQAYTDDNDPINYGMGWFTYPQYAHWCVQHGGTNPGTTSLLWRYPGQKFAVAITCNQQYLNLSPLAEYVSSQILKHQIFDAEILPATDRSFWVGFFCIWSGGLGYHDCFHKPATIDQDKLAGAFRFINEILSQSVIRNLGKDKIHQQIVSEFHPKGKMIIAGSHMASCLEKKYGKERLDHYRNGFVFQFLKDYIDLSAGNSSIPDDLRFSEEIIKLITKWNSSWTKTWTDDVRRLLDVPAQDFDGVVDRLKKMFIDETVYPRFNNQLNGYAYKLKSESRIEEGIAVLRAAAELYPSDANLFDSLGEFYLAQGDRKNAVKYYRMALEKDSNLETARSALEKLRKVEK